MTNSAVVQRSSPPDFVCRYCGGEFGSGPAMTRHVNKVHHVHQERSAEAAIQSHAYPLEPDGTILIENLNWVWS